MHACVCVYTGLHETTRTREIVHNVVICTSQILSLKCTTKKKHNAQLTSMKWIMHNLVIHITQHNFLLLDQSKWKVLLSHDLT